MKHILMSYINIFINRYTRSLIIILLVSAALPQKRIICGFITDESSRGALIGANIYVNDVFEGATTDVNGYYAIVDVSREIGEVVVSYIGYETSVKQFQFVICKDCDDSILRPTSNVSSIKIDIALSPAKIEADEISVSAEKSEQLNQIKYSEITLNPAELKAIPALAEPDIFRTLQSLPGVLVANEASAGLIIRGGNTDQNLILLDGITVYNPTHLGGVFSNFIVDGIKEAELVKGGYNSEYGGRLSSVLNITSREGHSKRFRASSSVSLLSAQTTLEGPLYKGAWLLSGRRTYFDKVFQSFGLDNVPPYYFYDIQGHVFSDITKNDRVSVSVYSGEDNFKFGDLDIESRWGNETVSLNYRRLFGDQLIGNFLIAKSKFYTEFGLGGPEGSNSDNIIDDFTSSGNFSYFLSKDMTLKFGWQYKNLAFNYTNTFGKDTTFLIDVAPKEIAQFVKLRWKVNDSFIFEPGARINYYDSDKENFFPELRLGLKYIVNDRNFINFSAGQYHQFIETFQDDFNPPILDNWIAVDTSVTAASANHLVLGYETYPNQSLKFVAEVYYKDINNTLTYVETRASYDGLVSDEVVDDILEHADGRAYGLELFLQKNKGKLTGWTSYSYSHSIKEFQNLEYYTNWDRRHVFNILASYNLDNGAQWRKNLNINFNWTFQTGQPYTPIIGYYVEQLTGEPDFRYEPIPGGRNSARYPAFHRLDLGINKLWNFKSFKLELFAQVINAYNRKNIFRYSFSQGGNTYNGIDDNGNWESYTDENYNGQWDEGEPLNDDTGNEFGNGIGDGLPTPGENNIDEPEEAYFDRNETSIFPLIPSIGIRIKL